VIVVLFLVQRWEARLVSSSMQHSYARALTPPGIFGLSLASRIAEPGTVYFGNLRVFTP
jgi:hypothetical protein